MPNSFSNHEDLLLEASIQESLQAIAAQMGHPIDEEVAAQLYRDASDLLNHIAYAAITLARVSGTLLVYQLQASEQEELEWFRAQIQQCQDDEEVEELIESIHRVDAL
jgi:hypothetical protein